MLQLYLSCAFPNLYTQNLLFFLYCICQQCDDDDVEDEDTLVLTDYTQITGVYLYSKEGAEKKECLIDAKKVKRLVKEGAVDPNRGFVHYKLRATDKNEQINLWDELIFDNYESILRSILACVKQKDMIYTGGK
jgi:hypothetical protein